jgi:hypothetical protein
LAWCLEKDYKNRSATRKTPAIVTIYPRAEKLPAGEFIYLKQELRLL